MIMFQKQKSCYLVYVMYLYWALLISWQIFRTSSNRSIVDISVKFLILAILIFSTLKIQISIPVKNLIIFILFAYYMIFSLLVKEPAITVNSIITYCFPTILTYLFYVHGYNYKVSKEVYIKYLNLIIITVLVMAVYSIIFDFDKFINALKISNAYGNELSSFLISNHEYALYLFLGLISCMFCYQFSSDTQFKKRYLYIIAMIVFAINLVLTYSRTALLGFVVMLVTYIFIGNNNTVKKYIIACSIIGVLVLIFSPSLQEYVMKVVLKENTDAGRLEMWNYGMTLFKDSPFFEKLTGYGYTAISQNLANYYQHQSFHNAYIQVLLQYGVIGFIFFTGLIVSTVINGIKTFRDNRFVGAMFLSMSISAIVYMLTNTTVFMLSTSDSFMFTIFFAVIPLYVKNAIISKDLSAS